jgi:hypothetical protein
VNYSPFAAAGEEGIRIIRSRHVGKKGLNTGKDVKEKKERGQKWGI